MSIQIYDIQELANGSPIANQEPTHFSNPDRHKQKYQLQRQLRKVLTKFENVYPSDFRRDFQNLF